MISLRLIVCVVLQMLFFEACRTHNKTISNNSEPLCKVVFNFGSRGSGIDHLKYEKLIETLKAKRLNFTEKAWGKEGEKEICIALRELSGKEKSEFIERLKTFEDKTTLVSLSIN